MSFWNDAHTQISIVVHEIDENKNKGEPDWSKF